MPAYQVVVEDKESQIAKVIFERDDWQDVFRDDVIENVLAVYPIASVIDIWVQGKQTRSARLILVDGKWRVK